MSRCDISNQGGNARTGRVVRQRGDNAWKRRNISKQGGWHCLTKERHKQAGRLTWVQVIQRDSAGEVEAHISCREVRGSSKQEREND
eukprot:1157153-Pelagomonas_calceolata.AAC.6